MHTSFLSRGARTGVTAVLAASVVVLAGCGSPGSSGGGSSSSANQRFTIVAPSSPGSGYDQTARAMQQTLKEADLATRVEVKTVDGAGGTIALSQFTQKKGTSELMLGGLALVGATVTNKSPNTLADLTPVARMIGEYEAIVVPADSKFQDLKSLLAALKKDPGSIPVAIGNQGGVDHIWGGKLAETAGVKPTDVNFVTFSGGGEALVALLGGKVAAGISGYAEFADQIEAGKLRVLAVSSAKPLEVAPDAPTIVDAGLPDAEFVNWRGIFAPPGISDKDLKALTDKFADLNKSSGWKKARKTNGWTDEFLDNKEFKKDLAEQQKTTEKTLKDLGLA